MAPGSSEGWEISGGAWHAAGHTAALGTLYVPEGRLFLSSSRSPCCHVAVGRIGLAPPCQVYLTESEALLYWVKHHSSSSLLPDLHFKQSALRDVNYWAIAFAEMSIFASILAEQTEQSPVWCRVEWDLDHFKPFHWDRRLCPSMQTQGSCLFAGRGGYKCTTSFPRFHRLPVPVT